MENVRTKLQSEDNRGDPYEDSCNSIEEVKALRLKAWILYAIPTGCLLVVAGCMDDLEEKVAGDAGIDQKMNVEADAIRCDEGLLVYDGAYEAVQLVRGCSQVNYSKRHTRWRTGRLREIRRRLLQ
jgi:hypothetical protein